MKAIRIFVSGMVQGVFFRAFVKEQAENLGLNGYVKNLNDGRVEIAVEGGDREINKIIEICRKGNPHSKVENMEVEEMKHQGFKDFKIII